MTTSKSKPILYFDGQCHFCRTWIARWNEITDDRVIYEPSSTLKDAVEWVSPEGQRAVAAEAVFLALATNRWWAWSLWFYRRVPGVRPISEAAYRFVAQHRPFFSQVTRFFWGDSVQRPTYSMSAGLFVRALGFIYLIAFVSLWTQITALVGSKGLLPVGAFLDVVQKQIVRMDWFRSAPTIFWLNHSDLALHLACGAGVLFSLALMARIKPRFSAFVLWVLYLSFVTVCQDFLGFQWDVLLLEAGFLAIFLPAAPSRIVIWLFHWLLFRLMITSGLVKWTSGDALWRDFTALTVHYQTQPLPTWTAWWMHQAPLWFQKLSVGFMFLVEVALPIFIFLPRRCRQFAAIIFIFFQLLIAATGNYCFFNLLTIALCLFLIDDYSWPTKWKEKIKPSEAPAKEGRGWILISVFIVSLLSTSIQTTARVGLPNWWPTPLQLIMAVFLPFHSFNSYGLFSVMTPTRPEIVIEGSMDGERWIPYEFKHKPGDVARRPRFVAPHQPRVDWQMWFAALSSYQQNRWFVNLCLRLLQNEHAITALLKSNPFAESPPQFVRATLYEYRFTTIEERRATGDWWVRIEKGPYLPTLRLKKAA